MSHLFGPPEVTKGKMAPKADATKEGTSQPGQEKDGIPLHESLDKLRKSRGCAKGSFTRILHTLQKLHDEPDLSIFKFQIDDAFKRLEIAKEKVTEWHERFMSHDESEEADDDWYDDVEESYNVILQAYSQYFKTVGTSSTKTVVSDIFKAGTYNTDLMTADEKSSISG